MIKRFLAVITLVLLLLTSILGSIVQASDGDAEEVPSAISQKVGGLLSMQVSAKVRAREAGGIKESTPEGTANILNGMQAQGLELGDLSMQRIFIHAEKELSPAQLTELEELGLIPYPESWIPPLENHPNGFLLADMPVDKLEELATEDFVIRLATAERTLETQNDLATQAMNVDDVWTSGPGYDGTGVTIAVIDSGIDLSHTDFPTPIATKDYHDYPALDDTVANYYGGTGHGTHVAGSALGRGTQSGGVYSGSAPGADLVFLKIGGDSTTSAPTAAIVGAWRAAVDTYDADVVTMSYSGWGTYHDGSSEESQAIDYAVSQGAVAFCSAGNSADDDEHYSGTVPASGSTDYIRVNVSGDTGSKTSFAYNLVWYDGTGTHNDLYMEYYDPSQVQYPSSSSTQTESPRGTESEYSRYDSLLPNGTYYVKVYNNSGSPQDFHLYYTPYYNEAGAGWCRFVSPDPNYTIGSPPDADNCIAVGAYTTRWWWRDYDNYYRNYGDVVNQIADFSSRGPRVDGGGGSKPSIVAPGNRIISCLDTDAYPWADRNQYYVDNDAPNHESATDNDGAGPADYYVMKGTSMATPHAAGVAALMLEANPGWSPGQVQSALESTAVDKGDTGRDDVYGYGLVDALAAIGTGVPALPEIAITPSGFDFTLSPGTGFCATMPITNTGGTNLIYSISCQETTVFPSPAPQGDRMLSSLPEPTGEAGEVISVQAPPSPGLGSPQGIFAGVDDALKYDDGTAETGYSWVAGSEGLRFAVRFTPLSYPASLDTAWINLYPSWPDGDHEQFEVEVWDDDGASGAPATMLGTTTTTATSWGWWSVDLSGMGISIPSGDFYIAYRQITVNPDCEGLSADKTSPDGRSWVHDGASWKLVETVIGTALDWMIRCEVGTDCSWLSTSPDSGTVAPSGTEDVTVSFDTSGLAPGDYTADINIASNDPDENPATVPVTLRVTGGGCNILFEQAHTPSDWTIEDEYSDWAALLESHGMNVDSLNTGPATSAALSGYDVVIISTPTDAYSTDEINALKQYVNDGGGLFIIGEHGGYTAQEGIISNQIATEFGITFNNDSVYDATHNEGAIPGWPLIGEFNNWSSEPMSRTAFIPPVPWVLLVLHSP